jgi:hypothetical protein
MADPTRIKITALDATRNAFRSVTRGLKGISSAVFSLKTGLVGLAGIGGFGLLIKSSLQSIDTLGKTATKLGVTTKELGALRYAAGLSGVEIRTVDMATQRFTRRLAEAANGTGEAKDALKELNLNAVELSELPLQQQMLKLSEAFGKVEKSSDQVRLAFKLFDSEGVSFVNILKLGSQELRTLFEEAQDLGILLSGTAVKGVEDANDAFFRLKSLFKGITDQTVAGLAPALEMLANLVKDNILQNIKDANGSVENFSRLLGVKFLEGVKATIIGFVEFTNALTLMITKIGIAKDMFGRDIFPGFEEIQPITVDLKFLNDAIDSLNKQKSPFDQDFFMDASPKIQELTNETKKMDIATKNLDKTIRDLTFGVDDFAIKFEKANNKIQLIHSLDHFGKIKSQLEPLKTVLNDTEKAFIGVAKSATDRMADSLTGLIQGTISVKDAFRDMANSIISDLIRMAIRKYITDQIFGFATKAISGAFGASTIQASNVEGGAVIGTRAIGGSVQRGKPYMVGERGAELFVPNRNGAIIPNGAMGGGAGVVVNQTINLSTGVAQTVRTEVLGMLPQIAEAAKGAVYDARRRGGQFGSAFGA